MQAVAKICQRIFLPILAKTCEIEIACSYKRRKCAKLAKVRGQFIATTTTTKKPDKYRKNHKNNKVRQSSDLKKKEKGKEGRIEVRDFCEIYGLLKVLLLLVILAILSMFVTQSF